ncbi:MAG: molybdopterin-guanine dinucleotide biosynthesis protein B [gamma proteobacterium symbiont of Bathyaustriella thionipta]|nr:molybdopterin-guanine dinucleotide biosynthesis protein B [gamma proteobacterium symbiont of Bathyaustriella thionipta]
MHSAIPLLGFAAYSGSGKTTLLKKVLPLLCEQGLRIGMIKHSHHQFEVDTPGKDSYELRKAGAQQMLIASPTRQAFMIDKPQALEPQLRDLLQAFDPAQLDLILVEGFRHEAFAKIEVHRSATGKPLLFPQDENIIALVADADLQVQSALPRMDINQPQQLAAFILRYRQDCLASEQIL